MEIDTNEHFDWMQARISLLNWYIWFLLLYCLVLAFDIFGGWKLFSWCSLFFSCLFKFDKVYWYFWWHFIEIDFVYIMGYISLKDFYILPCLFLHFQTPHWVCFNTLNALTGPMLMPTTSWSSCFYWYVSLLLLFKKWESSGLTKSCVCCSSKCVISHSPELIIYFQSDTNFTLNSLAWLITMLFCFVFQWIICNLFLILPFLITHYVPSGIT